MKRLAIATIVLALSSCIKDDTHLIDPAIARFRQDLDARCKQMSSHTYQMYLHMCEAELRQRLMLQNVKPSFETLPQSRPAPMPTPEPMRPMKDSRNSRRI